MQRTLRISLLAALLAVSGISHAQTLLNASYDVAREFYKDYNAAFVAHYKKTTGQDVKIDQSHAGSSAQAVSQAIRRMGSMACPGSTWKYW